MSKYNHTGVCEGIAKSYKFFVMELEYVVLLFSGMYIYILVLPVLMHRIWLNTGETVRKFRSSKVEDSTQYEAINNNKVVTRNVYMLYLNTKAENEYRSK